MNHVKVDKAEEAPDVDLDILHVNYVLAKVLFDTGASHSFVSNIFAAKHKLPLVSMANPLVVSSREATT